MKILMTVHHHLDWNSGAPGATLHLADEFRKLGHAVRCVSYDDLPRWIPDRWLALAFPVYLLRYTGAVVSGDVDLVDASTGDACLLSLIPRPFRRAIMVCRSHGLEHLNFAERMSALRRSGIRPSARHWLYHGLVWLSLINISLRRADLALVLNEADFQYLGDKLGCDKSRIHLVRNGINPELRGKQETISRSRRHLCFLGSWNEQKGIADLAAIYQRLASFKSASLTIAGCGAADGVVRAAFAVDIQSSLIVVPRFENSDLPTILADAGIMLFPSRSEGYGIAIVEALALGIIPICYRISGPSRIITSSGVGFLVDIGDIDAMVASVRKLWELPEARVRDLRIQASTWASTQLWPQVAEEQLALFSRYVERCMGS